MRTITVKYQVAKFNELNDKQKSKVLDNYRDINTDYDFLSYYITEYAHDLEILGFSNVNINYSISYSQGDGACFSGDYTPPKNKTEAKKRLKDFKCNSGMPNFRILAEELLLMNFKGIQLDDLSIQAHNSRYSHSNTVSCENNDLNEWSKKYMNEIYSSLVKSYEFACSDEAIIETIECNEYEFNLDTLKLA
jgi:hypothetical protein